MTIDSRHDQKKYKASYSIYATLFAFVMFVSLPAHACLEYAKFKHPVFENVKQIVIAVDVKPNAMTTPEQQAKLPEPLQKENLEKMLVELYKQRFKTVPDRTVPSPLICYGRRDQPIIVMDTMDRDQREKIQAYAEDPGTLLMILRQHIQGTFESDSFTKIPTTVFQHSQVRANVNDYEELRMGVPIAITHEMVGDGSKIKLYISNRIY